jgi:hypothetical protein
MDTTPTANRGVRLALVSLGLLALLAIVAFASRSGFGHHSHAKPTGDFVSYAFTVFLILFVLAIPVAVYAQTLQVREREVKPKSYKARLIGTVRKIVVFGVLAYVVLYLKRHHHHLFNIGASTGNGARSGLPHAKAPNRPPYEPTFEWSVLWVVLALAGIGAAVVLHRRLTREAREPVVFDPQATVAEDFTASIGDAIGDLEAEPDARRAVIAAYARMEGVLTRTGVRRQPSETSMEYLRRILLGLTTRGDAVTRLTELFGEAKFSRHEIDAAMKQEAIAALREIRDDLQDEAA